MSDLLRWGNISLRGGVHEFHDCSEGGDYDDIFELLDRVLASEGFVPGTP
jgi:hypothetical protein